MFPVNSPGVLPLCNAECTLKPPLFSPVLCYISRAFAEGFLICFPLRYTGRSLVHLPVHSPWVPLHVPCVSIYVHSCIPHRFPVDSFFFLTYEGFHSYPVHFLMHSLSTAPTSFLSIPPCVSLVPPCFPCTILRASPRENLTCYPCVPLS